MVCFKMFAVTDQVGGESFYHTVESIQGSNLGFLSLNYVHLEQTPKSRIERTLI